MDTTLATVFVSEMVGTAMLLLLGGGVVANVLLVKTGGFNGGTLMINFGWGLAVFAGVTVSYSSGAHLNPAVTIGIITSGATDFVDSVPVTVLSVVAYFAAQLIGAMIGALLVYLAYKKHFDATKDSAAKLSVFSTSAGITSNFWNLLTEIIATFVLVFVVLGFGRAGNQEVDSPAGLAALGAVPVALLVVGIGASLGGPTGYAINPARDLGPRIVHALLPITNKGASNWSYSWIPVVGPVMGGAAAGLLSTALLPVL